MNETRKRIIFYYPDNNTNILCGFQDHLKEDDPREFSFKVAYDQEQLAELLEDDVDLLWIFGIGIGLDNDTLTELPQSQKNVVESAKALNIPIVYHATVTPPEDEGITPLQAVASLEDVVKTLNTALSSIAHDE